MRTKEQFKAYVYEKAEAKRAKSRRTRNIWLRGVATCSLLIIIGIVALYGGIGVNNVPYESAHDMAAEVCETVNTYLLYSSSALTDICDGEAENGVAVKTTLDDYHYSASELQSSKESVAVEHFDYGKVERSGGSGVKTEDFSNTAGVNKEEFDVVELAKKECTIEYDTYSVAFDEENQMWRVVFYKIGTAGGDQTVYIDSSGITKLIVYGE